MSRLRARQSLGTAKIRPGMVCTERGALVAAAVSYDGRSVPVVQSVSVAECSKISMTSLVYQTARRYGVPVRTNRELAVKLNRVESGSEIPEELYHDVAELLCSVETVKKPTNNR